MNKRVLVAMMGVALGTGTANALEVAISGQINRAIMWVDDGIQSETHHVDNKASSSRFRFTGSDDLTATVKAGVHFEFEYLSNPSDAVTQSDKSTANDVNSDGLPVDGLKERYVDIYVSGNFGKISIGQGPGAADGGIESDLSGTTLVQKSAVGDIGGAIAFRETDGTEGPAIDDTIDNQDFESRYDRLRYDSMAFGPVKLVVSTGTKTDTIYEIGLVYNTELGAGGKLLAALGYSKEDNNSAATTPNETTGGSISWLAPFGLNVTFAISKFENSATPTPAESDFQYLKVGYKAGDHAMSVDFAKGDDFDDVDDESDVVGVGYVYTAAKYAEFYTGLKIHSLDRPGTEFEDITLLTAGTRLKF